MLAPAQDAKALARVLKDPKIGDFKVQISLNKPSYKVNQAIEAFFANRNRDDLLLLYFSGHGITDEDGKLYFAAVDTKRKLLRSTAISANFINDVMRKSSSRQQVLLLDCCYSGAFARGMVAKSDKEIGTKERFEGKGRIVLTASDAMQYSFEGDEVTGEGVRSIFTHALVHGLETGEADLDKDGQVSLDELYTYVHKRVTIKTQNQVPRIWNFDVQGNIIIANVKSTGAKNYREPHAQNIDPRILETATVDGQYSNLLHILSLPQDKDTYGNFDDFGYGNHTEWHGYKGLNPGYWVYVYPYWFIWGEKKENKLEEGIEVAEMPRSVKRIGEKLRPQDIDPKMLDKATVKGQYSNPLHILFLPEDKHTYGNFDDFGYWSETEWHGYKGLNPGYWVYVYPYWFIWGEKKEK